MGVVLTVSIKKKNSVGRWQVSTGKEKEKRRKAKQRKGGKKKQEAVPVQSRAQLIQPVGVRRVTQFGQSVHSLHNDLQHVADLPQDPARLDTTQHWKRR